MYAYRHKYIYIYIYTYIYIYIYIRGHFGSRRSSGCPLLFGSLLMAPASADVLHKVASTIGKCWKKHRRSLPLDIEESLLDTLLLLQAKLHPTAGASFASNVKEARSEVGTMLQMLARIASEPTECVPPPPLANDRAAHPLRLIVTLKLNHLCHRLMLG